MDETSSYMVEIYGDNVDWDLVHGIIGMLDPTPLFFKRLSNPERVYRVTCTKAEIEKTVATLLQKKQYRVERIKIYSEDLQYI
jgi:hypothetical protein